MHKKPNPMLPQAVWCPAIKGKAGAQNLSQNPVLLEATEQGAGDVLDLVLGGCGCSQYIKHAGLQEAFDGIKPAQKAGTKNGAKGRATSQHVEANKPGNS